MDERIIRTDDWGSFRKQLEAKNLILSPFCGAISCEDHIKAKSAR